MTLVAEIHPKHETFTGLSEEQVRLRRSEFGENVLPAEKKASKWTILFNQLKSPLVYIILTAALVSLIVGEYGDFVIIMVVVVVDAILGFVQEYQAQNTYLALKSLLKPTTTVLREGEDGPERKEIDVSELVPGDLVLLNAGEKIPGDGEILEGAKLAVDEAILTGESEPINKTAIDGNGGQPGASNVFMGTTLLTGRGVMRLLIPASAPSWARSPPACMRTSKRTLHFRCASRLSARL
jgi:Ca2+-transporting ATPase